TIPKWAPGDAGLDLHSAVDVTIARQSRAIVPLGIATQFPLQYVGILKDRSGNASKGRHIHGGVIDSGYRGEWRVIFENTGDDWNIKKGDRIAQVLFLPCFHLLIKTVDSLSDSVRGSSGFGSSGV
ncbi:hypothetical protein LCGC14_2144030, partial [marine sediment metagenome]